MPRIFAVAIMVVFPLKVSADDSADRILKYVPDDAGLVLMVKSLDDLAAGITAFGKAVGIEHLAEVGVDELLEPLDDAGFPAEHFAGLDTAEPLVLAMRPASGLIGILPLKQPAKVTKEVLKAIQDGMQCIDQATCVRVKDGFLIIGCCVADLEAATNSSGELLRRFRKRTDGLLDKSNVVFYARIPAWQDTIEQGLLAAEGAFAMARAFTNQDGRASENFTKWAFDAVRKLTSEAETVVAAGRIGRDGIRIHKVVEFKPEGPVGDYLQSVRKSKASLLRGLPDRRAAVVFGCDWVAPEDAPCVSEKMFRTMMAAPGIKTELGEEKYQAALKHAATVYRRISGYNAAMDFASDDGGMLITGNYLTEEPELVVKGLGELFQVSSKCIGMFAANMEMEIERGRERIGAREVEYFDFSFDAADEPAAQMINSIYGGSPRFYIAPVKGSVRYSLGPAEAARRKMGEALDEQTPTLVENKRIVAAVRTLSPDPQVCAFVDVTRFLEFAFSMSRASGMPAPPIKFPQTAPAYSALGVYFERNAVRSELNIPAEAIRAVVEAFESAMDGTDEPY